MKSDTAILNNWGPRNSFQRLLVSVYYWKTVEKTETDPSFIVGMAVVGIGLTLVCMQIVELHWKFAEKHV